GGRDRRSSLKFDYHSVRVNAAETVRETLLQQGQHYMDDFSKPDSILVKKQYNNENYPDVGGRDVNRPTCSILNVTCKILKGSHLFYEAFHCEPQDTGYTDQYEKNASWSGDRIQDFAHIRLQALSHRYVWQSFNSLKGEAEEVTGMKSSSPESSGHLAESFQDSVIRDAAGGGSSVLKLSKKGPAFVTVLTHHCVVGNVDVVASESSTLRRDSGLASLTREVKDPLKETLGAVEVYDDRVTCSPSQATKQQILGDMGIFDETGDVNNSNHSI
ncbi:hypothetical protein STEG23_013110, partial [Scotinomys teguina]